MSFAVVLEPDVSEALASLVTDVAELVLDEIERIAESPWSAVNSKMPDVGCGVASRSERWLANIRYSIIIIFQIGQDEESIHVFNIAVKPI